VSSVCVVGMCVCALVLCALVTALVSVRLSSSLGTALVGVCVCPLLLALLPAARAREVLEHRHSHLRTARERESTCPISP